LPYSNDTLPLIITGPHVALAPVYQATPQVPLVSITSVGRVATATTALPNSLEHDTPIQINGADQAAYNGQFVVDSILSATTFTYTMASIPLVTTATTSSGLSVQRYTNAVVQQLTSLSSSGGLATAVTPAPNGLAVGQVIQINGANEPDYDGKFVVTSIDPTTSSFTFIVPVTAPAVA